MGARFDSFHAKVLLFGEYTLMLNSRALSVPFEAFSGHLAIPGPGGSSSEKTQVESNASLLRFADYLFTIKDKTDAAGINIDRLKNEIERGLYFESDIPQSYGVGSSGALVAAVYSAYAARPVWKTRAEEFPELKLLFASMESFFHGKSSGLDPLICYAGKPLLVNADGTIEISEIGEYNKVSDFGIFLIDTLKTSDTSPLVNGFLKKMETEAFGEEIKNSLIPAVNKCIDELLLSDYPSLLTTIHSVSALQLELFPEMVPQGFAALWKEGLDSSLFKIKLCGSGGGGYLLCFTENKLECSSILEKKDIKHIPLM